MRNRILLVLAGIAAACAGAAAPADPGSAPEPAPGLAARYPADRGLAGDPDVFFFTGFEEERWPDAWSRGGSHTTLRTVAADPPRKFAPLQGRALSARLAQGEHTALNLVWKFREKTGAEPEAAYFRYYLRLGDDWSQTVQGGKLPGFSFRYYLRLGDDWSQTVQGGKLPGFSGTYGRAGWGGRRADGANGWSARGAFGLTVPPGRPLAGRQPVGTYSYHADQRGVYGDTWIWDREQRGYLEKNRWYCLEQYVKLNTPGEKDGILRAWVDGRLAFERTDLRFRTVAALRIEQLWMNLYHGGTRPSPYDQHAFIDNVVIARRYIGPMRRAGSSGVSGAR